MRGIITLFVLLFSLNVFAQNAEYSVVVKDIETQLPIENASVVVLKTKQMLLTNKDGKANFILNGGSNIQVSETNYEKLLVRWLTLKDNQFVVYLKSTENQLDELVFSSENPQKTLQKIVSSSAKKLTDTHRLKVFVREFFMIDNHYSYYNDGLVNFQFTIKQNKALATLLVEQNRSYGLLEADITADLKGYNLNDIMENYYSLKYFEPILVPNAKKEYDFIIKGHTNNKSYYVMLVTPKDEAKKATDSFEIVYDPEKKLIKEFTIIGSFENLDRKEKESKNITKSEVRVDYNVDGDDYYLLSSDEQIGFDVVLKEKVKNIEVRNSFVTTNYNKQNFTYNESDVFKEKTLFNKKNKILTNYWDFSGLVATEEEKNIIKSLDVK